MVPIEQAISVTKKQQLDTFFSSAGDSIGWSTRKQNILTKPSREVDRIALSKSCNEAVSLLRLAPFKHKPWNNMDTTILETDRQSAIMLSRNESINRKKHMLKLHINL